MAQTLQRPDADEDSFMRLTRTRTNKTQVGHVKRISCRLCVSLLWSIPPRQGLLPELTPNHRRCLLVVVESALVVVESALVVVESALARLSQPRCFEKAEAKGCHGHSSALNA
jgi:hypothetical protein